MKKRIPISQIMTQNPVTIRTGSSLYEADELFKKHGIRHLPVVDGEKIVGVLSRTDLLRISYSELSDDEESVDTLIYDAYTIPQVMTKNPITADADATIREVAEIFSKQSFHSMPVVKDGKLAGMVTTTDMLKYLLDQY